MRGDQNDRDRLQHVHYSARAYFESYYRATTRGGIPSDRATIGMVSQPESRFHYNVVENSIIKAILRRQPAPRGLFIEATQLAQRQQNLRLLDVGAGTGHWIDFFRDVFQVREAVGVELTECMTSYLQTKYQSDPAVRILRADVAAGTFSAEEIGGPVDYITAIGVMFHIVDDDQWLRALANLGQLLKPGGWMFVGGDFGVETRNVQFHNTDEFVSWSEHARTRPPEGTVLVNKRVRSLSDWHAAATAQGLRIADLVRSDREPGVVTPENDVLVLELPRPHE